MSDSSNANDALEGGCFCGAIRFSVTPGDYPSANCHCTMCRRTSAAAFVSWIVVPKPAFAYTRGNPKTLESSDHGTRYFCETCGTPIACEIDSHPDVIDVTICSFDKPETMAPKTDVYTDTRLPWITP